MPLGRVGSQHAKRILATSHTATPCTESSFIPCPKVPIIDWPAATSLDLRSNPDIRFIAAEMLSNLPLLQELDLRDTGVQFVSTQLAATLPMLRLLEVNLAHVENLAAGEWDNIEYDALSFGDVCCERNDTGLTTSSGTAIYSCTVNTVEGCNGCVFEEGITYVHATPITTPIREAVERRCDATSSALRCGEECAATAGCTHFVWDGRGARGISSSDVECRLLDSSDGRQAEVGITSGYTSAYRAVLDGALPRFHLASAPLVANEANGYTVSYGVSMGTRPMRGAIWLDFSLAGASDKGVGAVFTPAHLVFYADSWNVTQNVIVTLVNLSATSASALPLLDVIHTPRACDTAFLEHPDLQRLINVAIEIVLPLDDSLSVEAYLLIHFGVAMLLALACAPVVYRKLFHKAPLVTFVLQNTGQPPELTLAPELQYHGFLSHTWASGQDQVKVIKTALTALLPGIRLFLDVDDLTSIEHLEDYVRVSTMVILFISRGYWISKNCLREARAAVKEEKPSVLVHEADPAKGGISWDDQLNEVPADVRSLVNSLQFPVVPWLRLRQFQLESLKQIACAVLLSTPKYRGKSAQGADSFALKTTANEHSIRQACMEKLTRIYVSQSNPGAFEVAQLLTAFVSNLEVVVEKRYVEGLCQTVSELPQRPRFVPQLSALLSSERSGKWFGREPSSSRSPQMSGRHGRQDEPIEKSITKGKRRPPNASATGDEPNFFLLVLNCETFVGSTGDELASEVRALLSAGVAPVLVHDRRQAGAGTTGPPCEFERFFHVVRTQP